MACYLKFLVVGSNIFGIFSPLHLPLSSMARGNGSRGPQVPRGHHRGADGRRDRAHGVARPHPRGGGLGGRGGRAPSSRNQGDWRVGESSASDAVWEQRTA